MLWVLAVICSLLALELGIATYVPEALVGGMETLIVFAVIGLVCAVIAGTMRPRRTFGLVAGCVLTLFNV
jgi:hypothetical protein